MTTSEKRIIPSEHQEQSALFQWWHFQHPELECLLFATPNGGARNVITGANLKAEGVRRGVPDVCLAYPVNGYHGLYIEMKRRTKARVSPEQKYMLERLKQVGYAAVICKGWDEARNVIENYLGGQPLEQQEEPDSEGVLARRAEHVLEAVSEGIGKGVWDGNAI